MYIVLILTGIFAIWSTLYVYSIKKKGVNNIINNIKEYEQKERKNKCKVSSSK
tara:strand:- start:3023 stop:3181 length:159 start_codon:yes stop_codon:yes gene_type:complete